MRGTRALVEKELRQHGAALGGTTLFLGVVWLTAFYVGKSEARTLTALAFVARFAAWPMLAAALYVGHRLVVTEYFGRTQRFVEALPIPRGRMAAVKALFGLVWLELWALAVLALGAVAASANEPIDRRFFAVMAVRMAAYVFALWGVVFLLGFFGRLRFVFAATLAIGIFLVDRYTQFELEQFGPFALIDTETFGLERTALPARALVEGLAVGAAGLLGGWAFARVREGSIVEALARPLSPRELGALSILLVAVLTGLSGIQRDTPPEPFALTTDKVLRRGAIEIGYFTDDAAPAAKLLMAALAPATERLARDLGKAGRLPPLWVVHAPELPVAEIDTAMGHHERGVVLRSNLTASVEGHLREIVAEALHELLWAQSEGRAGHEPKHWLLDGLALHLALHGEAAAAPPFGAQIDRFVLRARAAAEAVPPTAEALLAWDSTSERLGERMGMAYAASAVHLLETKVGRDRLLALARAALTNPPTGNFRDVLHERRHPLPALLRETTGLSSDELVAAWRAALARVVAEAPLPSLPRGAFEVRAGSTVAVVGALDAPPAAPLACTLLHFRLPPQDTYVPPDDMSRTSFVWSPAERTIDRSIEEMASSGERLLVTLECEDPTLAAPVRLLSRRVTVR